MSVIGSIKTNVAANTALLNLENTVTSLQNTQAEISTGLAVSTAKDNASYFSIATVLRSDSSALSSVSDTLNLGDSSLTVSSTALSQIQTTLSDIKNQLVDAALPNADMTTIQQKISADQQQLQNVAQSANFNGQNFLSVDSGAANYNSTTSFMSSYTRNSAGAISVGFININTSNTALFDQGPANPLAPGAITTSLTASTASTSATTDLPNDPNATPAATAAGSGFSYTSTANSANGQLTITSFTNDPNNTANAFANTITIGANTTGGAPTVTETVGADQAAPAAGDTLGSIATSAGHAATYNAGTKTLTFQVVDNSAGTAGHVQYDTYTVANYVPPSGNGDLDKQTGATGTYTDANGTTTTAAVNSSIMGINIAGLTGSASDQAKLNGYQQLVDNAIQSVNTSAATLGTAQSRIEVQKSFVSSLQTSLNDGVGTLVDADLNVASTRLQALQVQQQLGVQSLSIANQSSQMILKLFG